MMAGSGYFVILFPSSRKTLLMALAGLGRLDALKTAF